MPIACNYINSICAIVAFRFGVPVPSKGCTSVTRTAGHATTPSAVATTYSATGVGGSSAVAAGVAAAIITESPLPNLGMQPTAARAMMSAAAADAQR